MSRRRFSFISSLVIAVSICSICAVSTPAYASNKSNQTTQTEQSSNNKGFTQASDLIGKSGTGYELTETSKGFTAISVGGYDSATTVKQIVTGHMFPASDEQVYRDQCKQYGLDFDRLYNGYEGIASDYDTALSSVHIDWNTPKYGWFSVKPLNSDKTYWGYCDNLSTERNSNGQGYVGWAISCWKFIGDKWYYFDAHGVALASTSQMIEGKSYTFNADCSLVQ